MRITTNLPNLVNSFEQFKIIDQLQKIAIGNSPIDLYIQESINKKMPLKFIIQSVKQQVTENPVTMGKVIGEELALKILRFNIKD